MLGIGIQRNLRRSIRDAIVRQMVEYISLALDTGLDILVMQNIDKDSKGYI